MTHLKKEGGRLLYAIMRQSVDSIADLAVAPPVSNAGRHTVYLISNEAIGRKQELGC